MIFNDWNTMQQRLAQLNLNNSNYAFNETAGIMLIEDFTLKGLLGDAVRLQNFLFGLVLDGQAEISIDETKYVLNKNSYLILFPEQVARLNYRSDDFNGIFLSVSGETLKILQHSMPNMISMFLFIRQYPCAALTEENVKWIKQYHHLLLKEAKDTTNMFRRETCLSLLIALTYKLSNIYGTQIMPEPQMPNRQADILATFVEILEKNYKKERGIGFYASKMSITSKYLSITLKKVSGMTANEWIQTYVLQEAKRLLLNSRMSVQQIAIELNFTSQSFFGKYFKLYVGMSPARYRKEKKSIPTNL